MGYLAEELEEVSNKASIVDQTSPKEEGDLAEDCNEVSDNASTVKQRGPRGKKHLTKEQRKKWRVQNRISKEKYDSETRKAAEEKYYSEISRLEEVAKISRKHKLRTLKKNEINEKKWNKEKKQQLKTQKFLDREKAWTELAKKVPATERHKFAQK